MCRTEPDEARALLWQIDLRDYAADLEGSQSVRPVKCDETGVARTKQRSAWGECAARAPRHDSRRVRRDYFAVLLFPPARVVTVVSAVAEIDSSTPRTEPSPANTCSTMPAIRERGFSDVSTAVDPTPAPYRT